jgi:hypothetical protein
MQIDMQKCKKPKTQSAKRWTKRDKTILYKKKLVCKEPLEYGTSNLTLIFMVAKPWDPNPSKGSNLTQFSNFYFLKNRFSHLVLTQMRTSSLVFSQIVIHGDTLRESN